MELFCSRYISVISEMAIFQMDRGCTLHSEGHESVCHQWFDRFGGDSIIDNNIFTCSFSVLFQYRFKQRLKKANRKSLKVSFFSPLYKTRAEKNTKILLIKGCVLVRTVSVCVFMAVIYHYVREYNTKKKFCARPLPGKEALVPWPTRTNRQTEKRNAYKKDY